MTTQRPTRAPSATHNNSDLLVWSCFQLGGFDRWIDVEELYLKAFELAPARLAWRTRPDLPDYKKCAKALQELEDPKRSTHLGLLAKKNQYLRKLTADGKAWCESYHDMLAALYGSAPVPAASTQEAARLVRHVESTDAFRHFTTTGKVACELWQLAESLRCLPDSRPEVWMARLDAIEAGATRAARTDVAAFVDAVRAHLPKRADFVALSR